MKENWTIEFVNKKAEKEVDSLSEDFQAKFKYALLLIKELDPFNVGMPYIKPLGNKLWEIRMKADSGIARSIYIVCYEKRIVILHTFIKKTDKTPRRALEKATHRMKEIKNDSTV